MPEDQQPPVCDYEGSDYQTRFWETGGREYEDRSESYCSETPASQERQTDA